MPTGSFVALEPPRSRAAAPGVNRVWPGCGSGERFGESCAAGAGELQVGGEKKEVAVRECVPYLFHLSTN